MTYAEEDALLAALPEPHATAVRLAVQCGGRLQSELLPVLWSDVKFAKAQLTITAVHSKNGRARHLPLSADMVTRLRAMQAASTSALVFPAPGGGLLHRFKNVYFRTVRKLGLAGLSIHPLRHSWASRMVEAGCDLVLLQQLGGWSSLALVSRYAHCRQERAIDATARMLAARSESPQALPTPITRVEPRLRDAA